MKVTQDDGWVRDCGECGIIVASGERLCSRCRELRTLRATVADLKARLKVQTYHHYDIEWCAGCNDPKCRPCLCRRARNLRLKKWRKP